MKLALISRTADFWLLGGASLVVWAFISIGLEIFKIEPQLSTLLILAAFIQPLVAFPHHLATYRMAYQSGSEFIFKNWFPLLFVPIFLIFIFIIPLYLLNAERFLLPFGLDSWAFSEDFLALAVLLTYVNLGWHTIKQAFGCMMVYGHMDDYPIDRFQRLAILLPLQAIWIFDLLQVNSAAARHPDFLGVHQLAFMLPASVIYGAFTFFALSLGVFLLQVVWKNWSRHRRLPSTNFIVPLVNMTVWWTPLFFCESFHYLFTLAFHSLQYLPFLLKYEQARAKENPKRAKFRLKLHYTIGALLGALSFLLIPIFLHNHFEPIYAGEIKIFAIFVFVFMNVHHFFIDTAIWHMHQPEMRRYILDAEPISA